MAKPATRDDVLDQIRRMPIEDREYIEAELMREAYEAGRRSEPSPLVAELVRRAEDALAHPDRGVSREEAVATARAAVDRVRTRTP